ncbi:RpiR family transcriptional regulator [Scopulibacillus darangshiensis]|uniref:RpiR family transcriptional regulator n=1 Tax=Scopulibacillus darangshiensis TaxID=442528 RepID=A0A4R2P6K5_9BACL|nr:RpiR family transcriptional regulator [Scopulibacillus darangshiensis]
MYDFIDDHHEDIIYDSITELSEKSGIGNATIVRFCKKLGFKGYPEFKVALVRDLSARVPGNVFSGPIEQEDSIETIAKKFYKVNLEALEATMSNMDYDMIKKAALLFRKAGRVHFAGIGHSGMTALETKYKFMRIGFHSDVYTDDHTMLMMASIMDKSDLVFAISHSGETKEIAKMLKIAKTNGAHIIFITGNPSPVNKDDVDYAIHYSSTESLFQTGAVSTKVAQLFVIDLIYTEVARLSMDDAIGKKIKTAQIIKTNK